MQKEEAKEDRGVTAAAARQLHIFTEQVAFVLVLKRWDGIPKGKGWSTCKGPGAQKAPVGSEGRKKLGVSICGRGKGSGAGEGGVPGKLPVMKPAGVCKRWSVSVGLGSSDDTCGCKVSREQTQ